MTTCLRTKRPPEGRVTQRWMVKVDVAKHIMDAEEQLRAAMMDAVRLNQPAMVCRLSRVMNRMQALHRPLQILDNVASSFNILSDAVDWLLVFPFKAITGEDERTKQPVFGIQVFHTPEEMMGEENWKPIAEGYGDSMAAAVVGAFMDHQTSKQGGVN